MTFHPLRMEGNDTGLRSNVMDETSISKEKNGRNVHPYGRKQKRAPVGALLNRRDDSLMTTDRTNEAAGQGTLYDIEDRFLFWVADLLGTSIDGAYASGGVRFCMITLRSLSGILSRAPR